MLVLTIDIGQTVRMTTAGGEEITVFVGAVRPGRYGGKHRAKLVFDAPQSVKIKRDPATAATDAPQ
jgi:sRNA-binding carbon storage regulator CsrA